MLFPKNFEEKTGFDKIKELLAEECSGPLGKAFVNRIKVSDKRDHIEKLLSQTHEFCHILSSGEYFPASHFLDVSNSLQKASLEGAFLSEEEFFNIRLSLNTLRQCLEFFARHDAGQYPQLHALTSGISFSKALLSEIDRVIDDRGQVRDNASPELKEIRSQILSEQSRIRKKLDQLLRSYKAQGLVKDDAQLTIREGRMVVPVAAEYKRRISGFVHDASASGQTVFIEPAEVLEINNEIRELEYREKREIVRILTKLTAMLRPETEALKKGYFVLGVIDFIRAKARLALQMKAVKPHLLAKPGLHWNQARHPLLYLNFSRQNRKVVPLNISLNEQNRILLISGPNAGGKSVCLKTVGLIQYMMQCGLLVPVEEGSASGIFKNFFLDIGDEQSLENDLSTYSSHLRNMKTFAQFADGHSLCLIDEFGTGTEPQIGGAIAEAILEALNQQGTFGVITTHYANLKYFADNTTGIVNGAMRYDVEHLEPLFELEMGRPGSSFALEIAQKTGLPRSIVQAARKKAGKTQIDVEKLLRELENEKSRYQDKQREMEISQRHLDKTLGEYKQLKEFIETHRKQLLNEAKAEAKALLRDANQRMEQAIKEIKESQADKEKARELRKSIENFKEQLQEEPVETTALQPDELELESGEIQEGDYVKLDDQATVGEVIELKGKQALVRIGELKTTIKLNRLSKISRKSYRQLNPEIQKTQRSAGIDMNEKMAHFSMNLDLRGKRAEEAIVEVNQFIDNAIMLNFEHLRIVHGKGDGVLRNLIRDQLRKMKQVARLEDEHADRGGAGVTLVTLR
jgi:DNA mismatch repair protein MutS2